MIDTLSKIKHAKFLSIVIGIDIIVFSFLLIMEIHPFLITTNILIRILKICVFLIFLILNVLIFLYYLFFIVNPILELNIVTEKMKILSNDLKSLAMAISELSRGNMIAQASITAEPINHKIRTQSTDLVNLYKQILNYIKDSIQDFNTITAVPSKRLLYVGADSFREGEKCGMVMGELLNSNGQVVILLNKLKVVGHLLRFKGFQSSLNKMYPDVEILGAFEEFEKVEETYRISLELIKKYPNLSGIYICEGTTPEGAARAIKDTGKVGKIKIVAHDLADPTMENVLQGLINATISQNPYVQGYDPVIHLYNYLINRKKPAINRLLTLIEVINQKNYQEFWSMNQGELISEKTIQALAVPLINTNFKKFKIAVILPDDKLFWSPVAKGARDAAKKLQDYCADVKCLIPKEIQDGEKSAEAFIPVIELLLNEGIDALSLPIFDRDLIPFLNKKIDNGLIVATYNSEPASFRGMVDNVAKHAQGLFEVSENLAAGSNESNHATIQINNAMKNILIGTKNQLEKLSQNEKNMSSLIENIEKITLESKDSSIAAEKTINAAKIGYQTVQKNRDAMNELLKSSKLATDIINILNEDTIKIQKIIDIIEDISSKTSVLSINAAIQSAHAGKEGKGFSVVSTEVRDLAMKSTAATKDIRKLIQSIQVGVEQATKSMTKSMSEVNRYADISNNVETALNDILKASSENEIKIRVIDSAVTEIQKMISNFKESMDSLAKLNRDNGLAVEAITQSTDDMSQQVQDLSNMAELLSDMSRAQEDLISQFILEESKKNNIS